MAGVNGKYSLYDGLDPILLNRLSAIEGALVENMTSMRRNFIDQSSDPRRNIDDECGYPQTSSLQADAYRDLYDREPIAARVVELMAKECFQVTPLIYEDEDTENITEFEKAWDEMETSLAPSKSWHKDEEGSNVHEMMLRVTKLAGIGHFGVLLLGIDDGKNLQDPIDGVVQVPEGYNAQGSTAQMGDVSAARRVQGATAPPDSPFIQGSNRNAHHMPDSYMTREEEQKLLGLKNLTANEVQSIRQWANDREVVLNKSKSPFVLGGDNEYVSDGQNIGGVFEGSKGGAVGDTGSAYMGHAVPPGNLSGTDQQYFGVQFGPSEVLGSPSKDRRRLVFLRAFDESLVQVVRYEWNIRNPRFGMPVMYRVTLNDPREIHSGVGLPLATVFVHWSRLIHVTPDRNSSEIFGIPRMRPVLNAILDIRKVRGAAAEGYWKTCFTGLSFETHPQLGGDVLVDKPGLKDQYEQYINGLQRVLTTSGMSVKTLAPTIVDPTPHIDKLIEAICIQLGCPIRIFKGAERGELASSQDDSNWNDRVRHYQAMYITPRVYVPFIDRLIQIGVLPEPEEYHIEWPDLDSLTDKDKAQISLQKTQALAAFVQGGCEAAMSFHDFYVRWMGMTEEEATEVIDAVHDQAESEDDMLTIPPKGEEGHPATPPAPPPAPIIAGGGMGAKPPGAGQPPGGKGMQLGAPPKPGQPPPNPAKQSAKADNPPGVK